tara:strand:+ start:155 stop:271 length:117 start_codon:yes stop_codon:yes gene_type:complete
MASLFAIFLTSLGESQNKRENIMTDFELTETDRLLMRQ